MKTRYLGNIKVSAVGYGCMGLSHGYGSCPSHEEGVRLIQKAFDLGCTLFDTAEGYGQGENEKLLGEAVEPFRKDVVIATKIHINPEDPRPLAEQIEQRLDASLQRLRTDHVELFYQHRILPSPTVEEVAEVMGMLIKKGKILGWGQSQSSADDIRRAHAITPLSVVQSEYSMMERMFEKEVIPTCKELGIGFVAFSPMASGFLSGKYAAGNSGYSGDDVRRVITRFADENVKANQPLLDMLHRFADEKHATPAQISLAWMLHKENFIVPIPGMRRDERIIENLGAADVELSEEEFAAIEAELNKITIHGNRTDEDIHKLKEMGYNTFHSQHDHDSGNKA